MGQDQEERLNPEANGKLAKGFKPRFKSCILGRSLAQWREGPGAFLQVRYD
jgi:hypothetical protein